MQEEENKGVRAQTLRGAVSRGARRHVVLASADDINEALQTIVERMASATPMAAGAKMRKLSQTVERVQMKMLADPQVLIVANSAQC